MGEDPFITDLKLAAQRKLMVYIQQYGGEQEFVGVHGVDEEYQIALLYGPESLDGATTRKVRLDAISSITLTEIEHNLG